MEEFSNDLIFQILIRVDHYSSAIRCGLVCKRWFSLVFSPNFIPRFDAIKRQLHPTTLLHYSICGTTCMNRKPLDDYLNFLPEHPIILASFKDLLLLSGGSLPAPNYYICNPFTRQWQLLPKLSQGTIASSTHNLFGLLCQEEENNNQSFHNKYKYRVLMVAYDRDRIITAFIFHSETGEWSKLYISSSCRWNMRMSYNILPQDVVSCNSSFYWLDRQKDPQCIVALDTDHIKFYFIDLPIDFGGIDILTNVFLGVLGGRLRLVKVRLRRNEGEFENLWTVWEQIINDDDEIGTNWCGWSLLVREKACGATVPTREGCNSVMSIKKMCLHPNDGDIVYSTCNKFDCVFRHNIMEGKWEDVLEVESSDISLRVLLHHDDNDDNVYALPPKRPYPYVLFQLLSLSANSTP